MSGSCIARTKATLGSSVRLADYLSTSLLARIYPASLISQLLNKHGCRQLTSAQPACNCIGVYYCMALSLSPEAAYGDVLDAVAQGLAWQSRSKVPERIKASSISQGRTRLCWPVLKRAARSRLPAFGASEQLPQCVLPRTALDGHQRQQF